MTDEYAPGRRDEASQLLLDSGFERVGSPFLVGPLEFEIEDVFLGPAGTLSLVVFVDKPSNREDSSRIYWLVQRLVRALDANESRRSVTVVIVGGTEDRLTADLQTIARVLVLDGDLPTRRLLAPLLRLEVRQLARATSNGIDQLEEEVVGSRDETELRAIISVASLGVSAIESALRKWIDSALATDRRSSP